MSGSGSAAFDAEACALCTGRRASVGGEYGRFSSQYGRYGYRRITAMLQTEGWHVNHSRVERLWRREGLKVPRKQRKRGRLRLNDGSCIRLRPEHKNHVWAYVAIGVSRRMTSEDVLERLTDLFIHRGVPEHIRSDNGAEFTAKTVREWLGKVGVKTLSIEPGSPWKNGYVESFNGKLRDEFLDLEIFYTLLEEKMLTDRWRKDYNRIRPHSALGYRPPAPEAIVMPAMMQKKKCGGDAPTSPASSPPKSTGVGIAGWRGGLT